MAEAASAQPERLRCGVCDNAGPSINKAKWIGVEPLQAVYMETRRVAQYAVDIGGGECTCTVVMFGLETSRISTLLRSLSLLKVSTDYVYP